MKNKEIVLKDICSRLKLNTEDFSSYTYFEKDNTSWLYTPCIVRTEMETFIQSWSYYINSEGRVLASEVNHWGESKAKSSSESIYSEGIMHKHLQPVLEILNANKSYFDEDISLESIDELTKDYSLEVVLQSNNYRVRIRRLLSAQISYDLYYSKATQKIKMNIFNPKI